MKLAGSYKLNVKKEIVWNALNDPKILKQCIPGCDSFIKENDNSFNTSATNQIGPMNATFSGSVKLSNIQKNESYTLSGEGQSPVGFANGSANVKLTELNGTTTLSYEVNINVGGKIAPLSGLIFIASPLGRKGLQKGARGAHGHQNAHQSHQNGAQSLQNGCKNHQN